MLVKQYAILAQTTSSDHHWKRWFGNHHFRWVIYIDEDGIVLPTLLVFVYGADGDDGVYKSTDITEVDWLWITPQKWGPKISRSSTEVGFRLGIRISFGGVVKIMGKGTNWANAGNWAKQLDGVPEWLQATLHWTVHWTVVFSTGREFKTI